MRFALVLPAAAAFLLTAVGAQAAPPGFAFLEIPTGVRAAALGGAYSSLAQGVEGVFWNPAALESARGMEITAGHTEWLQSLRHDHFSVAGHLLGGGIGASVRALYSEPIEERDELGNLIGSFGAHDLDFALAYGRRVGGGLTAGGSVHLVRERIANLAAMTYAFGAGVTWDPERWPGFRVALAAQNLGPSANYTIDGVQGAPVGLPAAVQGGASYTSPLGSRLSLRGALEGRFASGRNGMLLAGTEVTDASGAALRVGMRLNDSSSLLSFGAGYAFPALRFDYAFVPLRDDLGDTHRFGFSARF